MTVTGSDSDIRAVLEQTVDAMNAGDRTRLRALLADRSDALHIGSDPEEWLSTEEMVRILGGNEAAAVRVALDDLQVHRESADFAWAAGHAHFEDASGRTCPARLTAVLIRQGDRWTIVHTHASIGVRNDEMFD